MNQEKISKIIKDIRKENNLTQRELAQKLNVTYQAVSKWENEKNIPDIAILKKISEEFNIDISLLLDTPKVNKNSLFKRFILFLIFIVVIIIVMLFAFREDDFSFKKIGSLCDSFNITGSIAFNKDKSSIYISDIDYCGEEDTYVYNKITCSLYEKHDSKVVLVSDCEEVENTTLDNYLESVSINVNDYKSTCNLYRENDIYIEIYAYKDGDRITKFNIPLEFKDNCLE